MTIFSASMSGPWHPADNLHNMYQPKILFHICMLFVVHDICDSHPSLYMLLFEYKQKIDKNINIIIIITNIYVHIRAPARFNTCFIWSVFCAPMWAVVVWETWRGITKYAAGIANWHHRQRTRKNWCTNTRTRILFTVESTMHNIQRYAQCFTLSTCRDSYRPSSIVQPKRRWPLKFAHDSVSCTRVFLFVPHKSLSRTTKQQIRQNKQNHHVVDVCV